MRRYLIALMVGARRRRKSKQTGGNVDEKRLRGASYTEVVHIVIGVVDDGYEDTQPQHYAVTTNTQQSALSTQNFLTSLPSSSPPQLHSHSHSPG